MLELTMPLQDHLFPAPVPELRGKKPRERSKFQRGGSLALVRDPEPQISQIAIGGWLDTTSWLHTTLLGCSGTRSTGSRAVTTQGRPANYCSGHPRELELEEARQRLAAMPWRLVCMRFDDHPLMIAHNEIICKDRWLNATDGVDYITLVVVEKVFGSHRKGSRSHRRRSNKDASTMPLESQCDETERSSSTKASTVSLEHQC